MKLKHIILLLSLSFCSLIANSTVQISDLLIIDNDTFYIRQFPLDELEFKIAPFQYGKKYDFPSTACWRGYTATWKIIDDKLYLIAINECHEQRTNKYDIKAYFEKNSYKPTIEKNMIVADWFSGYVYKSDSKQLVIRQNKIKDDKSNYLFQIDNGKIIKE